ncbi:aminopeptidase P family protein [bacterium]|nr:aminopeptidase P family protein [candidate division CSSED10-310 bacterium]
MDIQAIQKAIRSENFDGWLLTDCHNTNPHARDLLEINPDQHASRRWYYLIPATGDPIRVVHPVESAALDHLPGTKTVYKSREHLIEILKTTLKAFKSIAMEYSPLGRIPAVSRVDAGTIDLVRSAGCIVTSSANLLQYLTARWGRSGYESHTTAAGFLRAIVDQTWSFVRDRIDSSGLTEWDVVRFILDRFDRVGLTTDHPPICAVAENSADPHYAATVESARGIQPNQVILIDLWARMKPYGSVYADITWTAFTGPDPDPEILRVFNVVKTARDAAVETVRAAFRGSCSITGAEVDRACRGMIEDTGYGRYFIHRTGHSLAGNVHGPGANIDSLESEDDRQLITDTGFTIEPGIYLPGKFGIRSELDVAIRQDGSVTVTGEPVQTDLILI